MSNALKVDQIVSSVSETHKFDSEYLFAINTSDVHEGVFLDIPLVETNELKGQFKKTIQKNDILFSEIRPANKHFAKVTIDDTSKYVASTKLMVLRKINKDVDLDYFYYWLTNDRFLRTLQSRAENRICSFPQITFELLSEYDVPVPEIAVQRRIAKFLSNIDSKIANNNAINAELEAMAKTIYDYWFLQFEFPDENGKPYKSSGGKMIYNEELKREIPDGWGVETLGDVLQKHNQSISSDEATSYPYTPMDMLPCNKMSFGAYKSGDEANSSLLKYEKYDVLFGAMRAYFHRVCIAPYQGVTRTTTFVLRPTIPKTLGYSYETLNADSSVAYAVANSIGTQQPYAVWENSLEQMIIPAVPCNLKIKYSENIANVIEKVIANELENQELASLRDFLLPLLMNGQVGFKEDV